MGASGTRRWLWSFCGALLVLRVVYAWALGVNSDEPQHLHVVWAWTRGLLPYRDVFDNHAPLFQLLSAPLFALIGERPQILPLMRIATIPWYALALWCTWRIGRTLFDARTGAWAALLTALWPAFFILSAEFRTDDGWAPLWLATVMIAIERRPTRWRAFGVGLLAGAACAVSLKSTLLLATLALASVFVLGLQRRLGHRLPLREIARTSGAMLLGFALLPAAIAAGFWLAGAWPQFVYCVFLHNMVPGLGNWEHAWRFVLFPLALPLLLWSAHELLRRDADHERGARRAFVFLAAMLYVVALFSYWPLITRQDLLPFRPLATIFIVALLLALPTSHAWRARVPLRLLLPLAAEFLLLLAYRPPWRDRVQPYVRELADMQRLTDPTDYVMDAKGEAIFRRRPIYFALEQITLERMQRGLIPNDIVAALRSTGTAVVLGDAGMERLPDDAREFIEQNYVALRPRMRVLGQTLGGIKAGAARRFDIAMPARYALSTDAGPFAGALDGVPYTQPRELAAGTHELVPAQDSQGVALIWARAVERGMTAAAESPPSETGDDG